MKFKYLLLDAFTQTPFSGAQIAVFPNADRLTDKQKKMLANELNLPEIVFISQSTRATCDAELEVYTSSGKGPFAGHAMMAGCYAMGDVGLVSGSDARVLFNGQELQVILGIKNQKVQISLSVDDVYDEYVPSNSELSQLSGIAQKDLGYMSYRPMITGNPEPYLIVPVKDNKALRHAQFSENKWQQSFVAPLARQMLLFTGEHPFADVNFAARIIGKGVAAHEDPPIGSAAAALGLYLAYGKNDYHRSTKVQRGDENSRVSILEVNVDKKGPDVKAIQLGGNVVKVGEGYFDLES